MAEVLEPLIRDEANVGFREIFEIRKVNNTPLRGNVARRDVGLPGRISCTMPFTLANGMSFVAIGCSEGIWVADPNQPDFLHRVMDLKKVTEFAIIEAYALLFILADKVLYCYTLDALDPYNVFARSSHKLTAPIVDFFRIGTWEGHPAIVYKRRSMTHSVFHVLEPILGLPLGTDALVADFGGGKVYSFPFRKEFYVPIDCTDLVFFKGAVCAVHPQGFEILDMQTLSPSTLPAKGALVKALAKRCKASRPLGLFRAHNGTLLLCYDTFGMFVDQTGMPLPAGATIDWHGTVYAAVPAAPYIVLFKARSIEVRCGASGRLEQVLFGSSMRCAWRGPGAFGAEADDTPEGPSMGRESRLQVVIDAPHGLGADEVAQHVYDFVPAPPPPLQNFPAIGTNYTS